MTLEAAHFGSLQARALCQGSVCAQAPVQSTFHAGVDALRSVTFPLLLRPRVPFDQEIR